MTDELRLYLREDGADTEYLNSLAGYLRQELLQLDVADVTPLSTGAAPQGARAFDAAAAGGLLVSLGQSAVMLQSVVSAVSQWLSRSRGVSRTVRVELGDDVLELSDVSAADRERLVELFVSRNVSTGG
ncbi:hypothetical protein WEB32_21975 [Streptomyces netropsis]|uniref:Uncharacterized protein n=1 Tax=Streptomyces netropsis TaxID=55404 RepID=A0A7W7PDJ5_STRNE|nr:hypothetical protein [Streptomyces netropsis]MBB4886054.1 hypothetical protein [Streptomyces netropsis]GGR16950.1 hypothetical protein GCM10010219_22360 [Streptomyces netropsis]